jgi:hypothetical protein
MWKMCSRISGKNIKLFLFKYIYVGRQGADDAPLWGACQGFTIVFLMHHPCTEEFPEQISDIPIRYSFLDRFDEPPVRNGVVGREKPRLPLCLSPQVKPGVRISRTGLPRTPS